MGSLTAHSLGRRVPARSDRWTRNGRIHVGLDFNGAERAAIDACLIDGAAEAITVAPELTQKQRRGIADGSQDLGG
jgi:hypothetical protein